MKALGRIWNLVSSVLLGIIVLLAVTLAGVRVLGLTPYAVLSGSMEPTYHVGSLIYVKKTDPADVQVGDPITFVVNEDLMVATHRVVDVEMRTTRRQAVLDESGAELGKLQEVISTGANDVFYVKGAHEYMIPAVPEFVLERNIDEGFIRVRLIEGMQTDAD